MFTKIECGECGGAYYPTFTVFAACEDCGHEMAQHDFILDEGESLTFIEGPLGYTTEEV